MFEATVNSLYNSDKVLAFIYNKLFKNFGPIRVLSILFFVPLLLSFVAGYLENTLYNGDNFIGVFQDYTLYGLWLVVFLSIYLYYKFSLFTKEFLETKIIGIIDKSNITSNKINYLDEKLSDVIGGRKGFKYLKVLLLVVFIFFHIQNVINSFDPVKHYGYDIWHSAYHPMGFIILKFFNLIYTTILLAIFFYKFIGSLIGFSWLFKKISSLNGFIIKPLAPDNAAGLRILSNLSIYFMYMVLPFFLVFITMILRGTRFLEGQQLAFLSLILLLFITFFLPLGFVHSAMRRAKLRELEYISSHFTFLNESVKKRMNANDYSDQFLTDINALEKIDFLYSKTEKMPVWPFNFENLGKVLLASLIPVMVFMIQLIVNADSIIYNLDKLEFFRKIFNTN
jgi:hypothetical protein